MRENTPDAILRSMMAGVRLRAAAGMVLVLGAGVIGCSSSEFTSKQADASEGAGGGAGSSGGSGMAATGGGSGNGGAASGGAGGGSDGPAAGGSSSALDSGAGPDASLPCPAQDRWCEGATVWSCSESTGPFVVTDCAASGQLCQSGDCVSSCPEGTEGCGCQSSNVCNAGLICVSGICAIQPLPPPLAHWRFDGNLTDSSGNGHDAEQVATVTYAVTGSETGAIFTDGWARNYSFATPFRNTLDSFTLSVRLRVDAYDREMPVFGLSAPGLDTLLTNKWLLHLCAPSYCAGVPSTGVVVETEATDAGTNAYATLGPLPPIGEWVHLALVVNANQMAYYVDGALVSSSFYTPAETLATVIHLGGTTSTTSSVHGAIDDIRVYDELFDEAQVAALFAGF